MKMQEIIIMARKWQIPFRIGMSKAELIRAIQKKEGYTACFQEQEDCDGKECLWSVDCITIKK